MGEYIVNYAERWLVDKGEDDALVLDDGSVWQVSPQSREKTKLWIRFSNMEVRLRKRTGLVRQFNLFQLLGSAQSHAEHGQQEPPSRTDERGFPKHA
jgi:hypothetical protein